MELRLSFNKSKNIRVELHKHSMKQTTFARSLACLLGKMIATTPVIPPALLFCRHLHMSLTQVVERAFNPTTHHSVSPLGSECHSRCGALDNSGLVRESELILEDKSPLWSHRSGPIWLQTDSSVPSLF